MGKTFSDEILFEEVIAKTGGKDSGGHVFSADDLRIASEMDDDLVFDEKSGELKLVMRRS